MRSAPARLCRTLLVWLAIAGCGGNGAASSDGGSTDLGPPPEDLCGRVWTGSMVVSPPPEIVVVLDASQTMADGLMHVSKSKLAALTDALDAIVAGSQNTVRWGLKVFPGGGADSCALTEGLDVAPAMNDAAAVHAAFRLVAPAGPAPMAAAIKAAAASLAAAAAVGSANILLASDGLATCGATDGGWDVVNAMLDARSNRVGTIVLGAADKGTPSDAALTNLAINGSTFAPANLASYFSTSDPGSLQGLVESLVGLSVECAFDLSVPVPDGLTVLVDGAAVPKDATNGWSVATSGHAIVFNGTACAAFYGADRRTIEIRVGC